jgi:serine/threonine protein kinase
MGCVSEDDLLEYVERRLSPEHRAETEAHLRRCDSCRELLAEVAPEANGSDGELAERYQIIGPLGAGGMGIIYAARDAKLRRTVALKMLRPGGAGDATQAKMRERLLREARAMAQLSHPNVLPVFDVGELDGDVFVTMELVEGSSLRSWLGENQRNWREVLDVFLDAARGLAAAHATGIIHRDFKPDNVLVGKDGRVRVSDFGLAGAAAPIVPRAAHAVGPWEPVISLTGTALAGSPAYMAPEQMRGEAVNARADIFSYCVALHEGLYGERPFAGESVGELESAIMRGELRKPRRANGVPVRVWRAVVRGLNAAPEKRFQSMEDVISALENRPGGAWTRHTKVALALTALAAVLVATLAVRRLSSDHRSNAEASARRTATAITTSPEAYALYALGNIRVRKGNAVDNLAAIQLFERAIALDAGFAAAHAALARAYKSRVVGFAPNDAEALDRAQVALKNALRLAPNLAEAHFAAGELLWGVLWGNFAHDRAIAELKRALELDPSLAEAREYLAMIYLHIGLLDEAEAEFNRTLSISPTDDNAHRRLGIARIYRGRYEEGLQILRQVAELSSDSLWNYQVAWALLYLGKSDESWSVIDRYLRRHSDDRGGVVTSTRALWFAKAGNARDAEADIRAAIEKGSGFLHFHHSAYNIASAYAVLGQRQLALKWLRTTMETGWPCYPYFASDPNLQRIRKDRGYVALMRELRSQWEGYKARARSAQWIVPDSKSESRDLLLRAKVQSRHPNDADPTGVIRLLEQAVSLDPDSAAAHAELAFAYSQYVAWVAPDDKATLERAEIAVAKALRLDPDLPEAHRAAAGLVEWAIPPRYAHDRAVRELKRALELNPNYAQAHQMLGNIYYHIGLIEPAIAEYRKAADLDPTGQNSTRLTAMALLARGEHDEALRLYRQVAPEANSRVWSAELAWTLVYAGKSAEAWTVIEGFLRANPDPAGMVTSIRAVWYAKAGEVERAEADIRDATARGKGYVHFHHAAYNIASAYALLGRPGPAVEWLQAAADGGWPCYPHYANDPNLAKIRGDPAFIAFMADLKSRWERYQALL